MTISAAFLVNGTGNPAAHVCSYSSTVTLSLLSTTGAGAILWEVVACSKSGASLPTPTRSGTPVGASAGFNLPGDPGDGLGRAYLVKCSVSDTRNTAVEYAVVGAVNAAGLLPIVPGEENARDATHGWSQTVNQALASTASPVPTSLGTPVASIAELKAIIAADRVDNQSRAVGTPAQVWIYSSGTGANFASDDLTVVKPTDVLLSSNGRWYPASPSAVVPTIAALRLAVSGAQSSIHVQAYSTKGDGGGGTFDFDTSDTTSADDGGVLIVAGVCRYRRRFSGAVSASWWGGLTTKYFSSSNGKMYNDVGLTTESSDDAAKVQSAVTFVLAKGGGRVDIGLGDWYFKTRTGPAGEFVILGSNLTISGHGGGTRIRIAPGLNAGTGYASVFGRFTFDRASVPDVDNLTVKDIDVYHNSAFNQFPGAAYGGVANPQNCTVSVVRGHEIRVENVRAYDHNGVFAFSIGTYEFTADIQGVVLDHCKVLHCNDDLNTGDSSKFAVSGGSITINRCECTNGTSVNYPTGNLGTAFELHPSGGLVFTGNFSSYMGVACNLVDYEASADTCLARDNVFLMNIHGFVLIDAATRRFDLLSIANNLITVRAGSAFTAGETGIVSTWATVSGITPGLGFFNSSIHHNTIKYVEVPYEVTVDTATETFTTVGGVKHGLKADSLVRFRNTGGSIFTGIVAGTTYYVIAAGLTSTSFRVSATPAGSAVNVTGAGTGTNVVYRPPTTSYNHGIRISGNFADFDIRENQISDFSTAGILLNSGRTVGTGNSHVDGRVWENKIHNCGTYGIHIAGLAGEPSARWKRLSVLRNEVTDDRGGSSLLQDGIHVAAYTDADCTFWQNRIIGYTSSEFSFDTATFTLAQYTKQSFLDVDRIWVKGTAGIGAAPVATAGLRIDEGATPAYSQFLLQANSLGAFSGLCYAPGNVQLSFDASFEGSGLVAKHTSFAQIAKAGALLGFYGNSGVVAGDVVLSTLRGNFDCATGRWRFGPQATAATHTVDIGDDTDAAAVNLRLNGKTQTTAPAAGAGAALPATPAGYAWFNVNGTDRMFPYY